MALELRDYQQRAVAAVMDHLEDGGSTLLLMATGTGKTETFFEVIRRCGQRALILAHTDRLVFQTAERIEQQFGYWPDVEKAESRDGHATDIVVGSVPTLARPNRLARFDPDAFGLVVVDEVHHAAADSYQDILAHFSEARQLGVTATARRMDGKRLGETFDSIAYVYDLADAIRDGWLVPYRRRLLVLEDLKLDNVDVRGGDFVAAQLEREILNSPEEAIPHAWARGILDYARERKVLAFTPGVESSRRLAEILNRYEPGSAAHLSGESKDHERADVLRRFRTGEIRRLSNCSLFGEGYDETSIDCIAMCRPTRSQPLYVQQFGRGTRPSPGKTDLLVLDFTDNSGTHDLVTSVNVLGDGDEERVIRIAEDLLAKDEDLRVDRALETARDRYGEEVRRAEREADRTRQAEGRRGVRARARFAVFDADKDPASILGVNAYQVRALTRRFGLRPLSQKQRAVLERADVPIPNDPAEARAILNNLMARRKRHLCSFKQARILTKYGIGADCTFGQARALLDAIAANRWRAIDPGVVAAVLDECGGLEDGV